MAALPGAISGVTFSADVRDNCQPSPASLSCRDLRLGGDRGDCRAVAGPGSSMPPAASVRPTRSPRTWPTGWQNATGRLLLSSTGMPSGRSTSPSRTSARSSWPRPPSGPAWRCSSSGPASGPKTLQEVVLTGSFGARLSPGELKNVGIFPEKMVEICSFVRDGALAGVEKALRTPPRIRGGRQTGVLHTRHPPLRHPCLRETLSGADEFPETRNLNFHHGSAENRTAFRLQVFSVFL